MASGAGLFNTDTVAKTLNVTDQRRLSNLDWFVIWSTDAQAPSDIIGWVFEDIVVDWLG